MENFKFRGGSSDLNIDTNFLHNFKMVLAVYITSS